MRVVEQTHPSIRIHLFGEFIVERLLPSSSSSIEAPRYERVRPEEWRSRGPAMALLKALVCRPRRRASRDALIETLWPPDEDCESEHAFDSAASILRKVMRTQQGESLLSKIRTGGVTIYALPNQQRLWVDADAFEQFIDQAMRAERAGEDALPLWEAASTSADLFNGVLGHFQTTVHLMRERPATSAYERLCSLAGEIAQMIGQMLFDMQDYATAWTYYKFSLHAAQEAANEDLRVVGLGRLSFLVADGGHVSKAILLLQEAQHGASRNAIIRCWLAAVEAEGQARLRNATACLETLDLAEHITAHQTLGEDNYATGFNRSRLAGYKGACFVHLHQPTEALAALREALALLDPQAIRRTSTLLTDMATAHVQQKEIEEACRLAHQALSMTIQTRSMSVLQRLGRLRRNLEPWKTLPAVKDIDEQLNTTLAMITS